MTLPISVKGRGADISLSFRGVGVDGKIVSQLSKTLHISGIPDEYALYQNYPNPFNPYTTILYDLPEDSRVSLVIYDILGREVRTLVNEDKVAGFYSFVWDGKDKIGLPVSTGVYIYRIHARGVDGGSYFKSYKMLMLK